MYEGRLALAGAYVRFVMEITKVQSRSDNLPPSHIEPIPEGSADQTVSEAIKETKKDR